MPDGFDRNVHCLLGIPFDAIDLPGAVAQIRNAAIVREPCFVSTPNVNWLVACLNDVALRDSVIRSNLSVVDGMPLVWVAKLLGVPICERVAGSGVFEALRADGAARMSVFFFGGQPGVAEAACAALNAGPGGLHCVGFESPGFGTIEQMSSDECAARINSSGADFVVVALGAKKGQAWIERNRAHLSAPIISHLGAVVDFVAGRMRRAPAWAQGAGLEWLWRIKEDPSLWRRYLFDGLAFLRLVLARVVPFAWFRLWHRPLPHSLASATAELKDEGGEVVLRLRGAWVQDNLGPLRDHFRAALRASKDIRLEMNEVDYVDSAFVGLAMLLGDRQATSGRRLTVELPRGPVRRIFRYCCADYLLAEPPR